MAERRQVFDPAVDAILNDGKRRNQWREMTKAQRDKARRDAKRQRVCLELDPRVVEAVALIARAEGCSPAAAFNLLVSKALPQYLTGEIKFEDYHQVSNSPRWGWIIVLGKEPDEALGQLRKLVTE